MLLDHPPQSAARACRLSDSAQGAVEKDFSASLRRSDAETSTLGGERRNTRLVTFSMDPRSAKARPAAKSTRRLAADVVHLGEVHDHRNAVAVALADDPRLVVAGGLQRGDLREGRGVGHRGDLPLDRAAHRLLEREGGRPRGAQRPGERGGRPRRARAHRRERAGAAAARGVVRTRVVLPAAAPGARADGHVGLLVTVAGRGPVVVRARAGRVGADLGLGVAGLRGAGPLVAVRGLAAGGTLGALGAEPVGVEPVGLGPLVARALVAVLVVVVVPVGPVAVGGVAPGAVAVRGVPVAAVAVGPVRCRGARRRSGRRRRPRGRRCRSGRPAGGGRSGRPRTGRRRRSPRTRRRSPARPRAPCRSTPSRGAVRSWQPSPLQRRPAGREALGPRCGGGLHPCHSLTRNASYRVPRRAVPTRTHVEPCSIAVSRSPDMPAERVVAPG